MTLLGAVGLVGIGYILKDNGVFERKPKREYGGYYGRREPESRSAFKMLKDRVNSVLCDKLEEALCVKNDKTWGNKNIRFGTRDAAEEYIEDLFSLLNDYGFVSIKDAYRTAGIVSNASFNDQRGWRDLSGVHTALEPDGTFRIIFPVPVPRSYTHYSDNRPIFESIKSVKIVPTNNSENISLRYPNEITRDEYFSDCMHCNKCLLEYYDGIFHDETGNDVLSKDLIEMLGEETVNMIFRDIDNKDDSHIADSNYSIYIRNYLTDTDYELSFEGL